MTSRGTRRELAWRRRSLAGARARLSSLTRRRSENLHARRSSVGCESASTRMLASRKDPALPARLWRREPPCRSGDYRLSLHVYRRVVRATEAWWGRPPEGATSARAKSAAPRADSSVGSIRLLRKGGAPRILVG